MNTSVQTLPMGSANTKPLWAAVSVLGVAVLALGASLVYVQTRPVDGHTAFAAIDTPAPPARAQTPDTDARLPVTAVAQDEVVVPARPAPPAAKAAPARPPAARPVVAAAPVARPAPAPAPVAVAPAPEPARAPVAISDSGPIASQPAVPNPVPVCSTCGRVESVTPVVRKGSTQGVGAVAGGVLGAVVGNQIGQGGGRALATILGAVGGGVAGNAVEKNMKKETVYQVQVRMDDGSLRTIEQSSLPAVGTQVIVDGTTLRARYANAQTAPEPKAMPQQARVYSSERT